MRKLATVRKINNLEQIEGADKIELATIEDNHNKLGRVSYKAINPDFLLKNGE